jgi:hypothetical protein
MIEQWDRVWASLAEETKKGKTPGTKSGKGKR